MKRLLFLSLVALLFLCYGCINISASALSVSFVNDYSGSMSASALQAMETAVRTFIGYMKTSDRGEYIAFGANIVPVGRKALALLGVFCKCLMFLIYGAFEIPMVIVSRSPWLCLV